MLNKEELIGKWKIISVGSETEDITLEFYDDGNLRYTIYAEGKRNVILLTYYIQDDFIVTDQPTSPRIEKTRAIVEGNTLTLNYDGSITRYKKV